jgi:hypothetical protein
MTKNAFMLVTCSISLRVIYSFHYFFFIEKDHFASLKTTMTMSPYKKIIQSLKPIKTNKADI